jgi:arylsulfatase A-like enzyme
MNKFGTLYVVSIFSASLVSLVLMIIPNNVFGENNINNNEDNTRPNILVIMGDDFGFSDLGVFGSEISTPNLDQLGKEGKILTNYYTHPVCSPARSTFLTGVDNHIAGIGTMYENIAPNQVNKTGYETFITDRVVTVAEILRDAGYDTLLSGKWHLSGKVYHEDTGPTDRGFDQSFTLLESGANHFTYGPYYPGGTATFIDNGKIVEKPNGTQFSNEFYTDKMIEFIKKSKENNKPFFGYLAFQVAHTPFQAPSDYIKKYEGVYDAGWDKIREKRFEKQKEFGIWPANMSLPQSYPTFTDWNALPKDEQKQRSQIFAAHSAMIEDMDYNIGKLIQFLKDTGQYDNTLIMFTSDNGGSEPSDSPVVIATLEGANEKEVEEFKAAGFSEGFDAIGGKDSYWGYGWQGAVMSNTPHSGVKSTMFNGGLKPPFVIKEPHTTNTSELDIVKEFVHVSDMTPTFLEYANATHPGSEYKGKQVSPMMGKSIKPLLENTVKEIHLDDEIISAEMFGNRAVFMGDWKARNNIFPIGDGQWKLFNIKHDIREATDLSKEHPNILKKMVSAYDKYAQNVGIIEPKYSQQQKQGVIEMLAATNQTEFTGFPMEQLLAGYPAEP